MSTISVNSSPERDKKIAEALPETPFTNALWSVFHEMEKTLLLEMLLKEIEVYRKFPKDNGKYDPKHFDPRNHKTCFMGMGFFSNGQGGWRDVDLLKYRQSVGTLHHPVWGNKVTLLEIWGGDHFERWPDMVKAVYAYGWGKGKLPEVKFYVNPLIVSKDTGTFKMDEEDKEQQRSMQLAQENELRRQYGLPPQDYLSEEIEAFKEAGNWDEKHRCPKDTVTEKKKAEQKKKLEQEDDDDD